MPERLIESPSESLDAPSARRDLSKGALARTVLVLSLCAFLFSVCAIFVGFHHTLYGYHDFRQTQTAISARYMEHGPFLRYETPILGPPWSIPFEFPLYQGIVAWISVHLSTPLEETGRALSILFFYLSFWPLASILRRLRFHPVQVVAILALFAVSPLYIFVSRLFMIESTALFFSLMYVDQMFRLAMGERPWQYRYMILAAVFGVLAGLVKITTFAPYFILGATIAAWHLWKMRKATALGRARTLGAAFFCGLLPVVCTWLWTKFCDIEKARNPIGKYFTSNSLRAWNFGTVAQRLTLRSYSRFWQNSHLQVGATSTIVLLLLLYIVLVRRWNRIALACLALYAGTILLFFNLHFVHTYYAYSNALFLVVAIGVLIAAMLALPGRRAWFGVAMLVVEMLAFLRGYHTSFYGFQLWNNPGRPAVAALIDRTTRKDDVIVISGEGWSSVIPYQSGRRAIMDERPSFVSYSAQMISLAQAINNQGARTIPEVVACDAGRNTDHLRAILQLVDIPPATTLHTDKCDIYLRTAQ